VSAPDRVAAFRDDIAASPASLDRLLDAWRSPELGGRRRFLLAGLGSSRYASLVIAGGARARGATAWVEIAGGGAPAAPDEDLVVVVVSASGRTPEALRTAERHAGRGLVVAVTNHADAPLAERADLVVLLNAGYEESGIAARSFRATLAALGLLTGATSVAALRPAADGLRSALGSTDWVGTAADALDRAASIDVVGPAAQLGVAEQAALMLREAPRLPAHAFETADWLHVGVYLALPGHRLVLLSGSPADDEVIDTVGRRGGAVVRLPDASPVLDPLARAIVSSVAAELLAAELWTRARASDKMP
jgi:glucosamine--fructose-6-phosphate aminotransferase (isomerizing)